MNRNEMIAELKRLGLAITEMVEEIEAEEHGTFTTHEVKVLTLDLNVAARLVDGVREKVSGPWGTPTTG